MKLYYYIKEESLPIAKGSEKHQEPEKSVSEFEFMDWCSSFLRAFSCSGTLSMNSAVWLGNLHCSQIETQDELEQFDESQPVSNFIMQ